MTIHTILSGKLEIVHRLPSSSNGNPRYLLRIDGFTFRTAPDQMLAYAVTNYVGKEVQAEIGTYYGKPTVLTIKDLSL